MVVADPPHMRRVDLSFRHAFARTNFRYTLFATEPDWWRSAGAEPWWRSEIARRFVLHELVKLPYYWIRAVMIDTAAVLGLANHAIQRGIVDVMVHDTAIATTDARDRGCKS